MMIMDIMNWILEHEDLVRNVMIGVFAVIAFCAGYFRGEDHGEAKAVEIAKKYNKMSRDMKLMKIIGTDEYLEIEEEADLS